MGICSKAFYKHWILFPTVWHLGETGENWDMGELGHYDYFYELTLLTGSIYLFADVQVPSLIYCCYLCYELVKYFVLWKRCAFCWNKVYFPIFWYLQLFFRLQRLGYLVSSILFWLIFNRLMILYLIGSLTLLTTELCCGKLKPLCVGWIGTQISGRTGTYSPSSPEWTGVMWDVVIFSLVLWCRTLTAKLMI